ncbi:hypothetical protein B0H34DRAFT_78993 [Crassisporium funariophilum]|nr:hypothetical protein B0H34DRAFT_78993 [Crassisporium funariophilum]
MTLPPMPEAEIGVGLADASLDVQILEEKNTLTRRSMNYNKSAFNRMLPREIAVEIFSMTIPPFTPLDLDTFTDIAAPLKLGTICNAWREIAWAAPTLWSSLTLCLPHIHNPSTFAARSTLLQDWISRSGDLPLYIRLCSTSGLDWGEAGLQDLKTLLMIVNRYTARWHTFILNLPGDCHPFLPPPDKCFPLLESLGIGCVNLVDPYGAAIQEPQMMLKTPRLRMLMLSGIYYRRFAFQWDILLHLDLHTLLDLEIVAILQRTQQLLTLRLQDPIRSDDGHPLPDNAIVLHSLERLNIVHIETHGDEHFLQYLVAPNLKDFQYVNALYGILRYIPGFLMRSACSLTRLRFVGTYLLESELLQLLRASTSLTYLSLNFEAIWVNSVPFSDSLLNSCNPDVAFANGTDCLLPRLETLVYKGPASYTQKCMSDMIQARYAARQDRGDVEEGNRSPFDVAIINLVEEICNDWHGVIGP